VDTPEPDWSNIQVVHSFEEAERLDREEIWAMTPDQRMQMLEILRRRVYGYVEPEARPPRTLPEPLKSQNLLKNRKVAIT
jgi:hypothetical protein